MLFSPVPSQVKSISRCFTFSRSLRASSGSSAARMPPPNFRPAMQLTSLSPAPAAGCGEARPPAGCACRGGGRCTSPCSREGTSSSAWPLSQSRPSCRSAKARRKCTGQRRSAVETSATTRGLLRALRLGSRESITESIRFAMAPNLFTSQSGRSNATFGVSADAADGQGRRFAVPQDRQLLARRCATGSRFHASVARQRGQSPQSAR
mmetsp:Transcript_74126/g.193376  ORF Transcript_74126/g.193376 Transcript_74126/m.193376 type:complete len:208 (-) Transcript_74126:767-1390(-)